MPPKYILYLSTNNIWGGSEVLWTQSAKQLNENGYTVKAGLNYNYELVQQFIPNRENFISLQNRLRHPSIFFRALRKLKLGKFLPKDVLHENIKKQKPDLIIISQGNNIDGMQLMRDCVVFNIPFVTITQLVTEVHWPYLNDALINELNVLYRQAKCNYFVSKNTQLLHEKLLGELVKNAAVIYNPFTKIIPADISFPEIENGNYKVALVGRIETFHKGYDLLIEILKKEKWKSRNIHFSLFGTGPHNELLKRLLQQNKITSFTIHNHIEDVGKIWKTHHILLMPSRMEGQSLSLIEAMHFKRAAIVTNVGGTAELIDEGVNGFIAEYATTAAIDAALERAWEKRADWEQLGVNAAKSIAHKHPSDTLTFFNRQIEVLLQYKKI
ncbi:glycosyltransferase family 4 protein [Ferruginibacter sp.]